MGSVKDLVLKQEVKKKQTGLGVFSFTDDYSVFDFGKMPDTIPGKGEALCRMACYNFIELEKIGVKTHFSRMLSGNEMEVKLVRVLFPQKKEIKQGEKNFLVPLEVIYRNSLPAGSSVFKRMQNGELTFTELGLKKMPLPGEKLEKAIIDFSTKLEETDTYLTEQQAIELAKISRKRLEQIKATALKINSFLNEKAESIGLEHADGKVEFAIFPSGELVLIDVCGTLDEDRFLLDGVHLSKQVLRDYYNTLPWKQELEKAKAAGIEKKHWPKPERLPKELVAITSNIYKSVCENWTGKKIWHAPKIWEVVQEYKEFLGK